MTNFCILSSPIPYLYIAKITWLTSVHLSANSLSLHSHTCILQLLKSSYCKVHGLIHHLHRKMTQFITSTKPNKHRSILYLCIASYIALFLISTLQNLANFSILTLPIPYLYITKNNMAHFCIIIFPIPYLYIAK